VEFGSIRSLTAILDCPVAMLTATFADESHLDDLLKYTGIKKCDLAVIANSADKKLNPFDHEKIET
jgi:hypothetical protein